MNSLVQQNTGIIGSQDAIAVLSARENARILVFGDSHGNYDVLKDIILNFGNEVDALIFCGDGFYDLVAYIEDSIHDEKMKAALPSVILAVKGNCDSNEYPVRLESDDNDIQDVYSKYSVAAKISCEIAGRTVFVAHGDHYRVDMGMDTFLAAAHSVDADLAFFGHTHCTHWEESGGTLLLNPGSCYRSRSSLPPSMAIVSFPGEQDRFNIEFFEVQKTLFNNYKFLPLAVHTN